MDTIFSALFHALAQLLSIPLLFIMIAVGFSVMMGNRHPEHLLISLTGKVFHLLARAIHRLARGLLHLLAGRSKQRHAAYKHASASSPPRRRPIRRPTREDGRSSSKDRL